MAEITCLYCDFTIKPESRVMDGFRMLKHVNAIHGETAAIALAKAADPKARWRKARDG